MERQGEERKTPGSLFPRPQRSPCLGLPAFLEGSFCRTVEFSQDRLLPTGLGFSVLPHPPRAGLLWGWGSEREEKRGLCPRGAGCSRTAFAQSRMCSKLGLDSCLLLSFSPRLAGPASLDFESLPQSPGRERGLQGGLWSAGCRPFPILSSPPHPRPDVTPGMRKGGKGKGGIEGRMAAPLLEVAQTTSEIVAGASSAGGASASCISHSRWGRGGGRGWMWQRQAQLVRL